MVSTTGTHYPCGSFIKEIVVIPNLLCWDKSKCSCSSVLENPIKVNGEKRDIDVMNLFSFTLQDTISEWSENFMQSQMGCIFLELEVAFCKHYCIVQNDEHDYMALRVIKKGNDEKVEVLL
jgi:hypothetical protein